MTRREKRKHARYPIRIDVAYQGGDGRRREGRSVDLSLGGMFLVAPRPLRYGTKIALFVHLPGIIEEIRIPATVRWASENGMGVQFGVMGARETHALTELISRVPSNSAYA